MSHNGELVALATGTRLSFYNTTSCTAYARVITSPIVLTAPIILCPLGYFLVFGGTTAYVYAHDAIKGEYAPYLEVAGGNATTPQSLSQSAIAVNGGYKAVLGCILTTAWVSADGRSVSVVLHSLLTKKQLWRFDAPLSPVPVLVSDISVHNNYIAVAIAPSSPRSPLPPNVYASLLVFDAALGPRPILADATQAHVLVDVYGASASMAMVASVGWTAVPTNTTAISYVVVTA